MTDSNTTDAVKAEEQPIQDVAPHVVTTNTEAKESVEDVVEITTEVADMPTAQVDASLQQSMMGSNSDTHPHTKHAEADLKNKSDVAKKGASTSGSIVFVVVAVVIACLLAAVGFLAINASENEPNEVESTVIEETEQPTVEPAPEVKQLTSESIDTEVQGVEELIQEMESVDSLNTDAVSDQSLGIQ